MTGDDDGLYMEAVYAGKVETLRFALKRAREIIEEVFEE